jgi:glutathione synthase/RimK-type ligase-like ATP-grasp enzyme
LQYGDARYWLIPLVKLTDIALKAVKAIGIRFASVDIAHILDDEKKPLRVLEVNSATMLDHKMDTKKELSEKIEYELYTKIVKDLFKDKNQEIKESLKISNFNALENKLSEQKNHSLSNIISQIAISQDWTYKVHSLGWIMHLSHLDKVRLVYGYTFPLNSSTNAGICSNKGQASSILKKALIPQIRHHRIFLDNKTSDEDAWSEIVEFAENHNYNIVCKPNEGSGGVGVEHVTNMKELQKVASQLFRKKGELVVSAYKKIKFEYRLIMLDNVAEIIFRKTPPFVTGDGEQTVQKLAIGLLENMDQKRREKLIKHIPPEILLSDSIPLSGEKVNLHWKHNLGQGALCELLGGESYGEIFDKKESDEEGLDINAMVKIAKQTVKALDVRFVSVDIVEIEDDKKDKKYRVMEVNSGVMMDNLVEQHGLKGLKLAATVYAKALKIAFSEEG